MAPAADRWLGSIEAVDRPPDIRIVNIPDHETDPYFVRLNRGLAEHGVEYLRGGSLRVDWLRRHRQAVQVIHLHHPSGWYSRSSPVRFAAAVARYGMRLAAARRLGYRIVWTAHNLFPHELNRPLLLERLGRTLTLRLADAVVVHFSAGVRELVETFGVARRFYVIPHGGYAGWYENGRTRQAARAELGLAEDAFVFLVFGLMRRYKGLEGALAAFESVRADGDVLVLAGGGGSPAYRQELAERCARLKQVRCLPTFVPDAAVQVFFNAADVAVYPYASVFNSGGVHLALAFGRPSLAPRLGCIPEVLTEACGLLFDPADPTGLAQAMRRAKGLDLESMGRRARERAQQFSPRDEARQMAEVYRTLLEGRERAANRTGWMPALRGWVR